MTRRHFQAIAAACKAQRNQFKSRHAYRTFCWQMSTVLAQFNDDFSMDRFLEACYEGEDKIITAKDFI